MYMKHLEHIYSRLKKDLQLMFDYIDINLSNKDRTQTSSCTHIMRQKPVKTLTVFCSYCRCSSCLFWLISSSRLFCISSLIFCFNSSSTTSGATGDAATKHIKYMIKKSRRNFKLFQTVATITNIHIRGISSPAVDGGTEATMTGTSSSTTGGRDRVMAGSSTGGAGSGGGGARGSMRGSVAGASAGTTASSTQ